MRHDHHILRGNLCQGAKITVEATNVASTGNVKPVRALIPTIEVHQAGIDTDKAADPLGNLASVAVHIAGTRATKHLIDEDAAVIGNRKVALLKKPQNVFN
jgi:hypothetical protein